MVARLTEPEKISELVDHNKELESVIKAMYTIFSGVFKQVEEEKEIEPMRYEVFKQLGKKIEKFGD